MDEIEQFVANVAALGLDGECETHEMCQLDQDDCVEVCREVYNDADLLANLIKEAREIMARSNQ
jgi:hypothetical protein